MKKVIVEYKVVYSSFLGPIEKTDIIVLESYYKYMYRIQCPNIDCTKGYFDISNEIWDAIRSWMVKEGKIKCSGQEEKYKHTNGFEGVLGWAIISYTLA